MADSFGTMRAAIVRAPVRRVTPPDGRSDRRELEATELANAIFKRINDATMRLLISAPMLASRTSRR
ncbi:hypothetical protein [Rhodoplanes roseus]|uniref:Uncharacterized protein n=1 Tax=Rhodoplanes roseus TaxID=29409 RepID=A0A327L6T0_9BRAD|nr:hypothetical protein [Rhodoplanes roseus]RAI45854.1 hypothetical protein CH341_01760 [Rhodoplanes roseus]